VLIVAYSGFLELPKNRVQRTGGEIDLSAITENRDPLPRRMRAPDVRRTGRTAFFAQTTGVDPMLGFSYVDLADVTVCRRLHHGVEQHHSAIELDLRVCCNPTPGH
jgi:hypothetical protein